MEEAKALARHQQQLLLQQQQHQQQQQQQQQQHQQHQQHHQQQQQQQHQQTAQAQHTQQQQFMLLQQLHKQQQAQQMAQASAISRFPSNIDAHLRPLRPPTNNLQLINPNNPNPNPNPHPIPNPNSNPKPNSIPNLHQQNASGNSQQQSQQSSTQLQQSQQQQQQQQQQKMMRPVNHLELQMAYQDAWRVCHPDFKRPFSSLEDACERLLPYHVVADYEAEEDDRILDSDTTGQMLSRSQQWDHNITAKVAEFTATFEKQALAFNIISHKRAQGEFRSEERMMIEQALCQEEKRAYFELKTELELRERAGQETKMRMSAMAQAEQARAESQVHADILSRGPIRASALGSHINDISSIDHNIGEQDHGVNPDEVMNGWGNNMPRDEKEPSEDFLNDDENENGDTDTQEGWRGAGEFDLNTR